MTKQKVAEVLGIEDLGRLKVWMSRYKKMGEFGLMDHRGRRREYVDEDCYVRRLEMENAVLKKVVGHYEGGGVPEKHRLVNELRQRYSVSELCKEVGISHSGFYAYLKRKTEEQDRELKALLHALYTKYDGKYGYRQLQLFLHQEHDLRINHKKVLRLMQELGIRSRIRRKHRCNYAGSTGGRVAENLLQRDFKADLPN
ncbi:hypothetical protein HMSSN139_55640 [Paenibacillus sp. HMSSN-139]|nr:hypothetical protein HMSSN139_55640 [Paenibacillus sp. HMSSN-139]